ncbi:UDP-glucose 4-epimerase [Dimargaris cristalligena]|uniref:UDP-glucose 4-epimerase n=1 Tax=Dimargaris cristalligena TaxID=215637 RepID=A0A4P9ZVL9_9FUNG|nr:UDP-glucose 4-epimerase [Dimargaris cristalligena]|eukprot:RKP36680.1 UDP-glucose 4-epimerase [Dimargaris cristalligena]
MTHAQATPTASASSAPVDPRPLIMVTGGAGFIGSHTLVELIQSGYDVVVVDSFVNSCMEAIRRVEKIVGRAVDFHQVDICDREALDALFQKSVSTVPAPLCRITTVIHFAALKAVGESVKQPLRYYENNISGTLALMGVMEKHGVRQVVFSSSATVYGNVNCPAFTETDSTGNVVNPYGRTKMFMEHIIRDMCVAHPGWRAILLRYFNPVGAHSSGTIGEDPLGYPNNLMPFICQVAVGKRAKVNVFGNDYPTLDGSGVRDYIHVTDLAQGHVLALESTVDDRCLVYNLGSGVGRTVVEVIECFAKVNNHAIPWVFAPRRPGDVARLVCNPAKAERELGFKTTYSLEDMCRDAWRWQSMNPNGFR